MASTCRTETSKAPVGRFVKRLAQFECVRIKNKFEFIVVKFNFWYDLENRFQVPLSQLRKSPEEREKLLEWMDDIIQGCNKWLRGNYYFSDT